MSRVLLRLRLAFVRNGIRFCCRFGCCFFSDFARSFGFRFRGSILRNGLTFGPFGGDRAFQAGEIIIHRETDFFHCLRPDTFNGLELLGRHIGKRFDSGNACCAEFLDQAFTEAANTLQWSRGLGSHGSHLLLDFLALLFFTLDIDLPAEELGGKADVLTFLTNRERKLTVVNDDFKMLLGAVDNSDAAHFRGLQCLFGERYRVFVKFDNVDLFPAQFADDRLHTHSLHADTSAYSINVFVLGHDGDLCALPGLPRDGTDYDRSVVDFWNFGLEQVLNQFRRSAGNDYTRALGGALDAGNHNADTLADGKGLEARLFLPRHAGFRFADVEDHVWAFNALHRGVDDLAHASDVFVVDGIALGLAHLLKDHLFRELCGDASQDSIN